MRSINLFSKSVCTSSLLIISHLVMAQEGDHLMSEHAAMPAHLVDQPWLEHSPYAMTQVHALATDTVAASQQHDHRKEHGGQIYSRTSVDNRWLSDENGNGTFKSKLETRIGSDENKIVVQAHMDKHESAYVQYDAKVLYSRMISDFWDVQGGIGYRSEKVKLDHQSTDTEEKLSAVVGLHGMAPYFFETEAYLYAGQDDLVGLSLETERDVLWTQKLILKPYLEMHMLFNDASKYAQKTGLSQATLGLETRYEISKKIMPYIDIAYEYNKGNDATAWQDAAASDKGWLYGAGLRFIF